MAQARPLEESAGVQSIGGYRQEEIIPNEELGRHIGKVGECLGNTEDGKSVGHRRRCALFIRENAASTLFVRS